MVLAESRATLATEPDSEALGVSIAEWILSTHEPLTIHLSGDLGTGKTTIARALLRGLGITGRIKSPSYALVETYVVDLPPALGLTKNLSLYCYHFDFYRFNDPREWLDAGFREHFGGDALCLVEWPERASGVARLPAPDLALSLDVVGSGRSLTLRAFSARGAQCLGAVSSSRAD